jgi:hypothetical protein
MELQMKAICEGTQTRNDVVQRNIEQYRAVFARTSQQMGVLKAVREQFSLGSIYTGPCTWKNYCSYNIPSEVATAKSAAYL